ncbi:bifunctional Thioredoxin-like superfamily/Thioredoxin domain [Babesia duncani]|uniref:Bifunctional Thioredoxin-like superfamily/Thioredoxin domain n=1 Tax=Babesia duncani TaxID=323732 RepID=A0AAD9PI38_9APIC|nr:bifunctional Thioredoxin-like superfamily/Thioredoxin domain [Babesia duncani]
MPWRLFSSSFPMIPLGDCIHFLGSLAKMTFLLFRLSSPVSARQCLYRMQGRSIVYMQKTPEEYKGNVASEGITIAKFGASWCKPCQKSKTFIEELSNKFTSIKFIEIDVDELPQIADEEGVKSIPFYKFFKNGMLVQEHIGGDKDQLQELILKIQQ